MCLYKQWQDTDAVKQTSIHPLDREDQSTVEYFAAYITVNTLTFQPTRVFISQSKQVSQSAGVYQSAY